jgi:methionine synthase II (cobalamin-independent)
MFATLLGALPAPPPDAGDPLDAVLRAQEEAGLEPATDGRLATPDLVDLALGLDGIEPGPADSLRATGLPHRSRPLAVEAWRAAASRTDLAVKQALPGPYSLLRRIDAGGHDPDALLAALATALRDEVHELAAAGCPLIEIEETEAHRIGSDAEERARFRDAHLRIVDGALETHLSLSIVGGSAAEAGIETIVAAPYASLAVDLIAGPDNWYLVVQTPGDRGIVAGVIERSEGSDDRPELPVWAAHYAASTGGRGLARVGLATAGGLERLSWPVAARKLQRLGDAARIAGLPAEEQVALLDPRALDIRTAAMGRRAPAPKRRPRRRP